MVAHYLTTTARNPQYSTMFEGSRTRRVYITLDFTSSTMKEPVVEQRGDDGSSGIEANVTLHRGAYYRTIVLVTTLEELWSERSHQ